MKELEIYLSDLGHYYFIEAEYESQGIYPQLEGS